MIEPSTCTYELPPLCQLFTSFRRTLALMVAASVDTLSLSLASVSSCDVVVLLLAMPSSDEVLLLLAVFSFTAVLPIVLLTSVPSAGTLDLELVGSEEPSRLKINIAKPIKSSMAIDTPIIILTRFHSYPLNNDNIYMSIDYHKD